MTSPKESQVRIEQGKLTDVLPDSQNANKHSARGAATLEKSLRKRGFFRPTAAFGKGVDKPVMGAGNLTQETAVSIGMDDAIFIYTDGSKPIVHVRTDIAPGSKEAQQLALEDNRVAELSLSWDVEVIAGFPADVLGDLWTPAELSDLGQAWAGEQEAERRAAQQDAGAETDKAEELQGKWNVKPGDVWAMENHRLICGDCRDSTTWDKLLQGVKANGVFTSPPYAEQRKEQYGGVPASEYVAWWEAVQANVKEHLAADGSFFVNIKAHSEDGQRSLYTLDLVAAMVRRFGWQFRDDFVWTHSGTPGDAEMMHRFKNQHEPIYWFTLQEGFKFRPLTVRHESDGAVLVSPKNPGLERIQGKRGGALVGATVGHGLAFPGNVISVGKNNDESTGGHVAAFPVGLPDFFIRAYSDTGDVWFDPFCGSGTTIIAAEQNGRRGMGIEVLPKYCSVILERWEKTTGKTPVLLTG